MGRVTAKITRNYGAVSVEFQLDGDAASTQQAVELALGLAASVGEMHRRFASEQLAGMKIEPPRGSGVRADETVVDLEYIGKEQRNGSTLLRCYGGNYKKWGVPMYEEAHRQYPDVTEFIASDRSRLFFDKGATMIVQMVDGKPKRVIGLRNE